MYTASFVDSQVRGMKAEGVSRADMIRYLTGYCQGWGYVFGAAGEMCTPANRKKYASYRPDHAAAIRGACPVLAGQQPACDGCKWVDTRIFDCRGFTRWLLSQVGVPLFGGTVTAQWEYGPNWVVKGDIRDMPRGLVCCVFRPSHTGMYVPKTKSAEYRVQSVEKSTECRVQSTDGIDDQEAASGIGGQTSSELCTLNSELSAVVRHCGGRKGQVTEEQLPGSPKWERFGIPAGLYTNAELEAAGVTFDPNKNIPTLRRGSSGDEVADLQMLLSAKYGADLEIDGVFGAKTEAAVKAFQKAHGLTADGVVGPKTRAALGLGGLSPTTQRPDGPIPVSVGADTIRPNPDAITDPAGGTVSQLPTSVIPSGVERERNEVEGPESSTVSQTEMIVLPLSDWQSIRAGIMVAYNILQNYE